MMAMMTMMTATLPMISKVATNAWRMGRLDSRARYAQAFGSLNTGAHSLLHLCGSC